MLKSIRLLSSAAILMASATSVFAGGFAVILGNPQANAEARALNAAVTAKAVGCGQPEKASVTAHAVGIVDGRRQIIPLKVSPLKEKGMFAVTRQWPDQGRWTIEFVAEEGGRTTATVARVTETGVDYNGARFHASRTDLDSMLDTAPVLRAAK